LTISSSRSRPRAERSRSQARPHTSLPPREMAVNFITVGIQFRHFVMAITLLGLDEACAGSSTMKFRAKTAQLLGPGVLVSAELTCTVVMQEGAVPPVGLGIKKVMRAVLGASWDWRRAAAHRFMTTLFSSFRS